MMPTTRHSERGAALLTVLMIIAAMAVAALGVSSAVTQSTQRARSLDAQAQLGLYAVAAEEVAKARMTAILEPLQSRLSVDLPGYSEAQIIPVDGGAFTVTVRDVTNCFDVNRLAQEAQTDGDVADSSVRNAYTLLLASLLEDSFSPDVTSLMSSLQDWMDENSVPGSGGAEDSYYLSEVPSYRTSGRPLETLDELRAIRGYSADIYRVLQPVLCALPSSLQRTSGALNINTLEASEAPLLQFAFGEALSLDDARALIDSRPIGGWVEVEDLLEDPIVNRIDPNRIQIDRLGLVTSLVEVSTNVSYRGYDMTMRFLFEALPGQPIRTLRRERIG
ncbi:MAG: type II secretion system minor pseudopilin GspK [Henriciella sp.]